MTKYFAYQTKDVVVLFSKQINHNKKIAPKGLLIVNHFTFSITQWECNLNGFDFFNHDEANCLSCVYRGEKGGCYAHKFHSYMSYLHHIKEAKAQLKIIPMLEDFNWSDLYKNLKGTQYFRVGVYGEPIFIPHANLKKLTSIAKNYTGYTHAWREYPEYSDILMASCNNISETFFAMANGWKTYTAAKKSDAAYFDKNFVNCPASKESNHKAFCVDCGLCRATKKSKPIFIMEH